MFAHADPCLHILLHTVSYHGFNVKLAAFFADFLRISVTKFNILHTLTDPKGGEEEEEEKFLTQELKILK